MATPSKGALIQQLRDMRIEPPPDASSVELQALVKKMKNLPADPLATRAKANETSTSSSPVSGAKAPPMRAAAPLARPAATPPPVEVPSSAAPTETVEVPAPTVEIETPVVEVAPVAAVEPPAVVMTDRERRPHDPFAGS